MKTTQKAKINKFILFAIALQSCLLATNSNAVIMPVTDPTSYTYYVEQINKTAELLDATREQIETLGGVRTVVDQQKKAMWGTYDMTMGAVDNLKRSADKLEKTRPPIRETLDINDTSGAYKKGGNYEEQVQDYLDSFYIDPRKPNPKTGQRPDPQQLANIQFNDRMRAIRNTIVLSESAMKEQDERIKRMEEMAKKINSAETLQEQTALGNRIMLEILMLMNEHFQVFLAATEANALANYRYMNEEESGKANQQVQSQNTGEPEGDRKGVLNTDRRQGKDLDEIFGQ